MAFATIALLVSAVAAVAGTAYTISQGGASLPKVQPPPPPPAPPPPPPPAPPPPTETEVGTAVAEQRRKAALRFGVEQTILASPLGGGQTPQGKSLLGGG